MAVLFQRAGTRDFLDSLSRQGKAGIDQIGEDEFLGRSVDDLVEEFIRVAHVEPLVVGTERIDGDVEETTVQGGYDTIPDPLGRHPTLLAYRVTGTYEFTGDRRLFEYEPSQRLLVKMEADIRDGQITVAVVDSQARLDEQSAERGLTEAIGRIRTMTHNASMDAEGHNAVLESRARQAIEQRKTRVMQRRGLAGALGFALTKRSDAPTPVSLSRRQLLVEPQRAVAPPRSTAPYRDEPALTDAQYEEVIGVVQSMVLAMERNPSVATSKREEDLRDLILVQLNASFEGAATGETFVQAGKTDILVRIENRHVFVAECKWWDGQKVCAEAIDQLLSYLPWRDEKAALILFVGRKDATSTIKTADETIRAHLAFKRSGGESPNPMIRRNYVLGHPDDTDREIKLAAMFAVLPKDR